MDRRATDELMALSILVGEIDWRVSKTLMAHFILFGNHVGNNEWGFSSYLGAMGGHFKSASNATAAPSNRRRFRNSGDPDF